jgi:hypothetical protein
MLTATDGTRYDETIKRVLFVFDDSPVHRYVLEVMRFYRNRSVHAGTDDVDRQNLVSLHAYVARLIFFTVRHYRSFASLEEIGRFLALPPDTSDLRQLRKRVNQAIRFRS